LTSRAILLVEQRTIVDMDIDYVRTPVRIEDER